MTKLKKKTKKLKKQTEEEWLKSKGLDDIIICLYDNGETIYLSDVIREYNEYSLKFDETITGRACSDKEYLGKIIIKP